MFSIDGRSLWHFFGVMAGRKSCKNSGGGTRTPDRVVNSHLLYQLSYSGRIRDRNPGGHRI